MSLTHPTVFRPLDHAQFVSDKMGKVTLFSSPRLLVGLNCFEPGQEHRLHTHVGMDKCYVVVDGHGALLLPDRTEPLAPGSMTVVPDGVPHGIRNDSHERLVVLAMLAPGAH